MESRQISYEYMKKVLLRPSYTCGIYTGPSNSRPGLFSLNAVRFLPARFASKVLALSMVFLFNQ